MFLLPKTISADASIDLHLHTTYSDGRWSAQELIEYAAQENFSLIAVTDHDCVESVAEIQSIAAGGKVAVLAAVEMSTQWHGQMGDVLCYGFDPHDTALQALTEQVRQRAAENAREVYAELVRRGYRFPHRQELLTTLGGELRVAGDCANLLIKHGYVADWPAALELIRDAGYREVKSDMAETVALVHHSGGVALIAHPGRGQQQPQEFTLYTPELLDQVRTEIPLDGIEVYYPTHTPEQVATYLAYAQQHDLLISAGSDSHGPPGRMPIKYRAALCQHLLERVGL